MFYLRGSDKIQASSILGIILAFFQRFEVGLYTKVDMTPLQIVEKMLKRTPKSTEAEFCNYLFTETPFTGLILKASG